MIRFRLPLVPVLLGALSPLLGACFQTAPVDLATDIPNDTQADSAAPTDGSELADIADGPEAGPSGIDSEIANDAGRDGDVATVYEAVAIEPELLSLPVAPARVCPSWQEVGPWLVAPASGIWASSDDDVWGLTVAGLWHWDGANITMTPVPCGLEDSSDLWGSDGELWATTRLGSVWHRAADGAWDETVITTGVDSPAQMRAVGGLGRDDVWAVGVGGVVAHWDGIAWSVVRLATSSGAVPDLLGVWAGDGDVWVVGQAGFTAQSSSGPAVAFRHRGADLRTGWERMLERPGRFTSVWGWGPDDIVIGGLASGAPRIQRFDGNAWSDLTVPYALQDVVQLAGRSVEDLWVFGRGGNSTLHRIGDAWHELTWRSNGEDRPFSTADMWPTPTGMWGFAGSQLARFSDVGRAPLWDACCYVNDIAGAGPDDVWLVGERGLVMHWDGTRYTLERGIESNWIAESEYPWHQLRGAWRAPDGVVWAVGDGGAVWRRDVDATWRRLVTPSTLPLLTDVWGSGGRVWITGLVGAEDFQAAEGVLWEWDGNAFHEVFGGADMAPIGGLRAVTGSGVDDVWAVGRGPSIWHFDGMSWSPVGIGTNGATYDANLSSVVSAGLGRVFAGGAPDEFQTDTYYGGITIDADDKGADVDVTMENEPIQKLWFDGNWGVAFDSRPRGWLLENGVWTPGIDLGGAAMGSAMISGSFGDGERLWVAGFDGHVWRSPLLSEVYQSLREPAVFSNWPFGVVP